MTYRIELSDPTLTFNAAHFLSFPAEDGKWRAERLHCHDFRFSATIERDLDECDCVLDFVAATEAARAVLKRWEYRIIVPKRNPNAELSDYGEGESLLLIREIVPAGSGVKSAERRIIGPRSDFRLVAATNASTEIIAARILDEWLKELESSSGIAADSFASVRVRLEEAPGCAAVASRP